MWGSNFILMKKATLWFDPVSVGAFRIVGGALFLAAVHFVRPAGWSLGRRDLGALIFIAALGYAFPFAIQPVLIERCGSGFIGMMVSFVPLMTIVASIPMLGVFPTPRQLLGVLGGLAFLMLIMVEGLDREVAVIDILLAVSVPLVYSICNTFIKRRFVGVQPLPLALAGLGLAMLFLLPYAVVNPTQPEPNGELFPIALASVIVLGVLGTGFGAFAFTKLLQDHGPLFASMVTYLIPLVALVWGWIDGEKVTTRQFVALLGVLVMVALVQAETLVKASPSKQQAPEPVPAAKSE